MTEDADTRPIRGGEFVALEDLPNCGFSDRVVQLCRDRFPDAGSCMGPKHTIGL
ncbi:hypothetical protein [Streptomyces sp. NPDC006510]|uniref:hypothetical protein n=1 Tax=Streptomyces sp. NPDC006510 TaxID=3155600 RepID=UPI0033A8F1C9